MPTTPTRGEIIALHPTLEELVNHPAHYGGGDNPREAIKVIEEHGLGFHTGNAVKYILRAGKKGKELEDLKKARWYINRRIQQIEQGVDVPVDQG